MKKALNILIPFILLLLLFGCTWEKKGVVDMSKLVTPDEIWEHRKEWLGKEVTLVIDTVECFTGCCSSFFRNKDFSATHASFDVYEKTLPNLDSYNAFVNELRDRSKPIDTIWVKNYDIGVINSYGQQGFRKPKWLKDDRDYISFTKDEFNEKIMFSPKKIVTGVLVESWIQYTHVLEDSTVKEGRYFILLPTGLKYRKYGHLELFDWSRN